MGSIPTRFDSITFTLVGSFLGREGPVKVIILFALAVDRIGW